MYPDAIRQYAVEYLRSLDGAWFAVDEEERVVKCGGVLARYHLDHVGPGSAIVDCFPAVQGFLPATPEPFVIAALELGSNLYCDLHLFHRDGMSWVLILDSTRSNVLREKTETELRAILQRSQQSEKMQALGRLAAGVAHDLNNLLTVIVGYSDLMQVDPGSPDHYLEQIRHAAERCSLVTRQLLEFSQKRPTRPGVLNLNDVVHSVYEMLRRLLTENIRLNLVLDAGLWPIMADSAQLEQVIVNLVVNSRDAMPAGGLLSIETLNVSTSAGRFVRLAVRDSGTGMDSETQKRIFEPFFTTKQPGKGTGLGLSNVSNMVMANGGTIELQSRLGEGTLIGALFVATEETAASVPQARPAVVAGNERILVVEDDASVLQFVSEVLSHHGYRVKTASNCSEAIAATTAGSFDLLLTDVILPDGTSYELVKDLQEDNSKLNVLFMSGYAPGEGWLENRAHLQKPFTADALLRYVRRAIDQPGSPVTQASGAN